jgi:hypothetical protein
MSAQTPADTALVEELSVTPGNVHDGRAGHGALPDDPGAVYADSAYRGSAFASAVQAKGGFPHVVQTGIWGREGDGALPDRKNLWHLETQLWDAADAMAWLGQGCPSSASYRPRLQSEANGDDPTNHDSVMTDFDRTSNSETANILSTSCDKLLVTVPTHSCENLKPRTGLLIPSLFDQDR